MKPVPVADQFGLKTKHYTYPYDTPIQAVQKTTHSAYSRVNEEIQTAFDFHKSIYSLLLIDRKRQFFRVFHLYF